MYWKSKTNSLLNLNDKNILNGNIQMKQLMFNNFWLNTQYLKVEKIYIHYRDRKKLVLEKNFNFFNLLRVFDLLMTEPMMPKIPLQFFSHIHFS